MTCLFVQNMCSSLPACPPPQGLIWVFLYADAYHKFTSSSQDCGFTAFMPRKDVENPQLGYLNPDKLQVSQGLFLPMRAC